MKIANRTATKQRCFTALAIAALACSHGQIAHAEDPPARLLALHADVETISDLSAPKEAAHPWHFEFGFRDGCTRLDETQRMIDRRLDRPLRFDVLNFFDKPQTPIDRKSDFMMTTMYLGFGRQESDWLIWTLYVGGGMGRDHDHQRRSNVNLEVNFKYAYLYTGLTGEIYPWKVPCRHDFATFSEALRASRPFVATGFETGYVSAEGRGHWKVAPLPRLYQDKVEVRDWITSVNFGLGWHLPVNRRWSVVLMGDYRFHFYRPDEYNGWTLTTALRYNLP